MLQNIKRIWSKCLQLLNNERSFDVFCILMHWRYFSMNQHSGSHLKIAKEVYFLLVSSCLSSSSASSAVLTLISILTGASVSALGSMGGLGIHIIDTLFLPCRLVGMLVPRLMFNKIFPTNIIIFYDLVSSNVPRKIEISLCIFIIIISISMLSLFITH